MIDGHAHIICPDKTAFPPAPPSGTIPPGTFDEPMDAHRLLRQMDSTGVDRALLVQRGSVYGFDNSYVCETARRHSDRFAAVCAIDAAGADGAAQVRRWHEAGAAGVRLMELRKGENLDWLSSDNARMVWAEAARATLPMCVHLFPWNRVAGLQAVIELAAHHPELPVIVDHFSNIDPTDGEPDYGIDALLLQAVGCANLSLKFTTIPLGRMDQASIDAAPLVNRLAAEFGPDRLFWGSDVGQSKGSYAYQTELGRQATRLLDEPARDQILRANVSRIYSLGRLCESAG